MYIYLFILAVAALSGHTDVITWRCAVGRRGCCELVIFSLAALTASQIVFSLPLASSLSVGDIASLLTATAFLDRLIFQKSRAIDGKLGVLICCRRPLGGLWSGCVGCLCTVHTFAGCSTITRIVFSLPISSSLVGLFRLTAETECGLRLLQIKGLKLLGLEHKQDLLLRLLGKAGLKKITRKSSQYYQWIEENQKVIVLNCFLFSHWCRTNQNIIKH